MMSSALFVSPRNIVATNASGPRRVRYGTARDLLLGVRFVQADGVVTWGGSKVVKSVSGYDDLIRPDRIHGSLYSDQAVFEDELERIWYRTWVYVGHESEVPEPGDYCRKSIGLQPVVLTRNTDGQVQGKAANLKVLSAFITHFEYEKSEGGTIGQARPRIGSLR